MYLPKKLSLTVQKINLNRLRKICKNINMLLVIMRIMTINVLLGCNIH